MPHVVNRVGSVFGRLTVIGPWKGGQWRCKCSCGGEKWVLTASLLGGLTRSCGCLHKERTSIAKTKHGKTGDRTYGSWSAMKARCLNPKNGRYNSHGGRGIKVCGRWLESFQNFLSDMGERPEGKSLERVDNDGHYEPGNCRWATPIEQASNTRSVKLVTLNGITDTEAGWARRAGISPAKLCKRLKRGWSFEKAVLE